MRKNDRVQILGKHGAEVAHHGVIVNVAADGRTATVLRDGRRYPNTEPTSRLVNEAAAEYGRLARTV